jgi:glyoxylase-like metal-dependent hydrolase (beta-lactamase superfamily II)
MEMKADMTDFFQATERWAPEPIADGTYLIDLGFEGVPGVIGSFLMAGNDELVLFESGPTTTVANLEHGISEAGYALADVSRLIVSHIHLDHAGAAGTLMRMNPALRLSVHAAGAPYLIDPDRLVKSAARIFGDRMDPLWGEVVPVDADRVDTMEDGDVITAGGRELHVRHAPGHAGSHVVLLDQSTGVLLTGDAAGARLKGTRYVCPTLVPPELDITVWAQTIDMMKGLGASRLALTHCGAFGDVERHLDDVIPNLEEQIAIGEAVMLTPDDDATVIDFLTAQEREEYVREGGDLRQVNAWMRAMNLAMPPYVAAQGLKRIFKKAGRFG